MFRLKEFATGKEFLTDCGGVAFFKHDLFRRKRMERQHLSRIIEGITTWNNVFPQLVQEKKIRDGFSDLMRL